jgi:hypothetical protein
MTDTLRPDNDETAFSRDKAAETEDENHARYKKSPEWIKDIGMVCLAGLTAGASVGVHFLKTDPEPDQAEKAIDTSFAETKPLEKSVFKVEIPVQKNPAKLDRDYLDKKIGVFEQAHPDYEVESCLVSETRNSVNTVIIITNPKSREAKK